MRSSGDAGAGSAGVEDENEEGEGCGGCADVLVFAAVEVIVLLDVKSGHVDLGLGFWNERRRDGRCGLPVRNSDRNGNADVDGVKNAGTMMQRDEQQGYRFGGGVGLASFKCTVAFIDNGLDF